MKKNLVEIIKNNPGCIAVIDNDSWRIEKEPYDNCPFDCDKQYEDCEEWIENNILARSSDDIVCLGDGGYGSGNCYGGDILQALAVIVGIKVESV